MLKLDARIPATVASEACSVPEVGAQFRAIAELHGDLVWTIDCASGLPTYLSTAAVAMLGYDLADVVEHFLHPSSHPPLAALCAGLEARLARFATGDASRQRLVRNFELAHPDGHTVAIEVTSLILTDAAGAATTLVGTIRNVEESREMAAQQRKFISMLNHEFRTPLSTIDGAIQRLEVTGAGADEATRQRYRNIQAAVERLIGLLDEHLSPERLAEVGAVRPADGASPAALLQEAADLARLTGRDVIVELGELPDQLRCQPSGLRLALKVLMDNALQYAPAARPITLKGQRADGGLELLVCDEGPGVPADELDSIFGKRVRGSNARGAGSGLGLYLARSVIEVHGGSISVQNSAPQGAQFRIWLPAQGGAGKKVASFVINSDNSGHQVHG